MKAKILLALMIAVLLFSDGFAQTQQAKKIPRIGWISFAGRGGAGTSAFMGSKRTNRSAFVQGLRDLGYAEGHGFTIEYRSAEGREERLVEIAAELVRLRVDVIVADSNAATDAAVKATTTIPIVFLHGDPLRSGVVPTLANHGRNVTGLSSLSAQLAAKRLELFKDAVPKIKRVAVLLNPEALVHTAQFADMQALAQSLAVRLQRMELRDGDNDFDSLFQQAVMGGAHGLIVLPNPFVSFHRRSIVDLASQNRLPTMYPFTGFTEAGGLMSYGPDTAHQYYRAAYFADRILKGAKPSDLPVEQPTKFELTINLNTAKALGLTIPSKVLMWADRVLSDRTPISEANLAISASGGTTNPAEKIPRIGVLSPAWRESRDLDAFKQELHDLGYVEGKNVIFEYAVAEGNEDRIPSLAAELVRTKVNAILVASPRGALAAQRLTSTIPIIVPVIDGVGGLINSLHRPGRNVTGLSFMPQELNGKRLELLKETVHALTRISLLVNRINPEDTRRSEEIKTVAHSFGVQLKILNINRPDELENAFSLMTSGKAEAVIVGTTAMFTINRKKIVELAAKNRLPAIYHRYDYVEAGGLMSYGPNHTDLYRRAATYMDKILKGAKPGDLPVEQPTKFELVINLKTAKTLGLTIPPKVLMWADRVIE